MTYYEKYAKRVKYNSREALKDRAFYRRLEKDYNSFFFLDKKIVIDKSVILGSYL